MDLSAATADDFLTGLDEYEPPGDEIPCLEDLDEPGDAVECLDDDFDAYADDDESGDLDETAAKAMEQARINAAHEQVIPGISTGALLEAMEKPEVFAEIARGDLYVQMHHMRRAAADPRMTPGQRIEYSKWLAQVGKVDKNDRDGSTFGALPTINISFPGSGQSVRIGAAGPDHEREPIDVTPDE